MDDIFEDILTQPAEDGVYSSFSGCIIPSTSYFPEEERSKQPSLFSLVRVIKDLFGHESAGQLGFYGALGYDFTFQFEPITLKKERDSTVQRDLVLFLPDEIWVVDNQKNDAWKVKYEFTSEKLVKNAVTSIGSVNPEVLSTIGLSRVAASSHPDSYIAQNSRFKRRDIAPGEYAKAVVRAKEEFRIGNLFEVVLSQVFREKLNGTLPSTIFRRFL